MQQAVFYLDRTALGITSEDEAMLQALYSRSADSVMKHLERVKATGSGKFMSQYYIGYGHGSIGDCGDVLLFVENVSILAAKAIQDSPLYNGQECSTRYIDWSSQPFFGEDVRGPYSHLYKEMREFYIYANSKLPALLKEKHQIKEGEKEAVYERAINARAFDVLRGFLPAGALTNLSWKGSLRQIHEKLVFLFNHPLEEVQHLALTIWQIMNERFPSSFKEQEYYTAPERSQALTLEHFYSESDNYGCTLDIDLDGSASRSTISEFLDGYNSRVGLTPQQEYDAGTVKLSGFIDYGSHRDLQRHRRGTNVMPLLTPNIGFERWYIDNLISDELKDRAAELVQKCKEDTQDLHTSDNSSDFGKTHRQYYLPMGFKVPYQLMWNWNQILYVARLRSTPFIHPTLRTIVHQWISNIEETYDVSLPDGLVNYDPNTFDIKRGAQTIEKMAQTG